MLGLRRRVLAVPVVALVALGLGGYKKVVERDGAQKAVSDVITRGVGHPPRSVKCPSGVEAKVGKTFECDVVAFDGSSALAHVRITAVQGKRVVFAVNSGPR